MSDELPVSGPMGICVPETGIRTPDRPLTPIPAFNWSNLGLALTFDGETVEWCKGKAKWQTLVSRLVARMGILSPEMGILPPEERRVLTEKPFESYNWRGRERALATVDAAGWTLVTVHPITVKEWKVRLGGVRVYNASKKLSREEQRAKEEADAKVLWHIANRTNVHLDEAHPRPRNINDEYDAYEAFRRDHDINNAPLAHFVRSFVRPPFKSMEVVYPFVLEALHAKTRDEFDRRVRFVGFDGRKFARATMYRAMWGTQVARALYRKKNGGTIMPPVVEPREMRKALRRLYHDVRQQVEAMGIPPPEMGIWTPDPSAAAIPEDVIWGPS